MNDTVMGIVTRSTDYKDNDVILNVLTENGFVALYARGIKKMTSRNAYACQLFDLSEFSFDAGEEREMHILKTAVLKREFSGIKEDYDRLALGSVVLEIVNQLEDESNYHLLAETLELLENTPEPFTVFSLFITRVLKDMGLDPSVDECVNCGQTKGIETISIEDGGFLCHDCNVSHIGTYDVEFLRKYRIINKADYSVVNKLYGLGLNDYRLARMQMEFLMYHSGMKIISWRSVMSA